MSERSLSIKIRRARKELKRMQSIASIVYDYLGAIRNINRCALEPSPCKKMYIKFISIQLGFYSVKTITEFEKIIRKQKSKIKEYDKRICKLQSTQSTK